LRPEDEQQSQNKYILEFLAVVSGHCHLEQALDPLDEFGINIAVNFLIIIYGQYFPCTYRSISFASLLVFSLGLASICLG
jgi:hypothetical protein